MQVRKWDPETSVTGHRHARRVLVPGETRGWREGGGGQGDEWYMYRLVHLAMKVWIGRLGDAAEVTMKATRHIANRTMWRAYLPYALRLLGSTQDCNAKEKSKLSLRVGRCLKEDGTIPEAVRWLKECCRRRERLDENVDQLFPQHTLARAYQADRQVSKAVELLGHVSQCERRCSEKTILRGWYHKQHLHSPTPLTLTSGPTQSRKSILFYETIQNIYHAQESTVRGTSAFSLSNSAAYFSPPSLHTNSFHQKSLGPNLNGVVNSQ